MTRELIDGEEAASWVIRLDQPAIDTSAGPEFDRWMRASDRHVEEFADVEALWQSEVLKQALQQAVAVPVCSVAATPRGGLALYGSRTSCIAAALCTALVTVTMLLSDLSLATYRTGTDNAKVIALADGSHVDMSRDSELRVRILPWQRSATLVRGEAFFDIRHERLRMFHVHSGTTSVRVLGTAFNVDRQSATQTAVEVYRGAVEVDIAGAHPMVLHRGERTRVADGKIAAPSRNVRTTPDWKSGWFEADDVPMSVLVAKVQQYSSRPIKIDDEKLRALPISGRFQVSDPARVLKAVHQAYGLDVRYRREQIEITSAAPKQTG